MPVRCKLMSRGRKVVAERHQFDRRPPASGARPEKGTPRSLDMNHHSPTTTAETSTMSVSHQPHPRDPRETVLREMDTLLTAREREGALNGGCHP